MNALLPRRSYLLVALLGCCLAPGAQDREADAFLTGRPLSLEQIRDAIGVIYEGRLQTAIRNRGVAFRVTGKELELLREAGASAAIAEELKRARGPAPEPALPAAPDPEGRQRFAAELLRRAATTLGDGELAVTGRLLLDRPENRTWRFSARMPRGGGLEVETEAGSLAFAGENCEPSAPGQPLPAELAQSLRLFCQLQPVALVRRILGAEPKLTAEGPLVSAAREWVLRVPSPESCELALSRNLLPVELKYGGAQAAYSNYLPAEPYPRDIVIRVEKPTPYRAQFLIDSVLRRAAP